MNNRFKILWVINLSLLFGLMLMLIPLPEWAEPFRPNWVSLILIFWCIVMPGHAGLVSAFLFGLLLDIAMGTLLGQHALGLTLAAYIILKNHQRLRIFPLIQQGVIIMFVLLIQQLMFLWVYGITKRAPDNLWLFFMPSVISMLLWPWLFIIMRDVQRRFMPLQRLHE